MALSHLGHGKELTNVETDTESAASACRRFYDDARDAVLADFAWPFASKTVALGLIEEDPNDEWGFSYRYPTDCLEARRILSGFRNDTRDTRIEFKQSQDDSGRLIFCDKEDAELEYTVKEPDPTMYSAPFIIALSFRLAAYIAPRVTAGDPFKLGDRALKLYYIEISSAQKLAANEEQPVEPPDAEWVRDR